MRLEKAIEWAKANDKHGPEQHITIEEANEIADRAGLDHTTSYPQIDEYHTEIGSAIEAETMTNDYGTWSRATEVCMLMANGIQCQNLTNKQLQPMLGRVCR